MNKTITIFGSAVTAEEAASKGAFDNGGLVYGVTVDLWDSEPNRYITIEVREEKLFERIIKLLELGDAYIILQGGTGTLLEFAAVWEFANKNLQQPKPIICHSRMWKEIADVMNKQMLIEDRRTDLINFFDSPEEILDYLKTVL